MSDLEKGSISQIETVNLRQTGPERSQPRHDDHNDRYHHVPRPSQIADASGLGLFAFSTTTLILSLINVGAKQVHTANVFVGMGLFTGGLVQLLAGMWEFPRGKLLGATLFSMYGSFWISYAVILLPGSGIIASYADSPDELANGLGLYLMAWFTFTILMLIAVLRINFAFIFLLADLAITFLMLALAEFTGKASFTTAGGAFGIVLAIAGYYCALALVIPREHSYVTLPLGHIAPRKD